MCIIHACIDGIRVIFPLLASRQKQLTNNNNDDDDLYSTHIHQLLVLKAHCYPCSSGARIIPETISAPRGVYSSIAAITAHTGLIRHNNLTGTHLLLGGEKQLW